MCKTKLHELDKICRDKIRIKKDFEGYISHCNLRLMLCKSLHVPREQTDLVIKQLRELGIIEYKGHNINGMFYKVN